MFFKIGVLKTFAIFSGKHLFWSLFLINAGLKDCNFIKKETLAQVYSCKFCEISKNIFFTEQLRTTASVYVILQAKLLILLKIDQSINNHFDNPVAKKIRSLRRIHFLKCQKKCFELKHYVIVKTFHMPNRKTTIFHQICCNVKEKQQREYKIHRRSLKWKSKQDNKCSFIRIERNRAHVPIHRTVIWHYRETFFQLKRQPPKLFCKKGILKNFAVFTGKHLCWSLFLIKMQSFRPVNIAKFLRTRIMKNICVRPLLQLQEVFFNFVTRKTKTFRSV